MSNNKKLPKELYVRWEDNEPGETPWLIAAPTLSGVMDDDGPRNVGLYRLVEVARAEKTIKTMKAR